jgi:hypothetical protein
MKNFASPRHPNSGKAEPKAGSQAPMMTIACDGALNARPAVISSAACACFNFRIHCNAMIILPATLACRFVRQVASDSMGHARQGPHKQAAVGRKSSVRGFTSRGQCRNS